MENLSNMACPVCTLFLRPGITLEQHLTSHPKQKVIEALIRVAQLGPQNIEKINCVQTQASNEMTIFSPPMNVNANQMNQVPANHSIIYQQFMSSSASQPIINLNPMNHQQFVAVPTVPTVPTVFNPHPQMICSSPYIFQQQQQVQIVSAATNMQPFVPRQPTDIFPSSSPAICSATDIADPLNMSDQTSDLDTRNTSPDSLTITNVSDDAPKCTDQLSESIPKSTLSTSEPQDPLNIREHISNSVTETNDPSDHLNITLDKQSSDTKELTDPLCTTDHKSDSGIDIDNSTNVLVSNSNVNSCHIATVSQESSMTINNNTRETNSCNKILYLNYEQSNTVNESEDKGDEEDVKNECASYDVTEKQIIIETQDEEVVSITISNENESAPLIGPDIWSKDDDFELNKACQTTGKEEDKDCVDLLERTVEMDLTANEKEELDDKTTAHATSQTVTMESQCLPSSSGLQSTGSISILAMEDDINFILPADYMQNGQSIISRVDDLECINEANRDDRPQILMNIGNEMIKSTNILMNIEDEKSVIEEEADYECRKYSDEKIDEESVSRESLNIRADEKMPPRGELSEQESNGASEVGWGSRIYQEGSSGMSTSYDLLARESWEASDCSDSEIPPLQSRIPPSMDYQPDVDDPEEVPKKPNEFRFSCSTCGLTFRCPKERRVHQANEHATSSNIKKTIKKRQVRATTRKIKPENTLDNFVKRGPKLEPREVNNVVEIIDLKEEQEVEENVLCNTCGEMLPSMKDLTIHNKKVHNIRPSNHSCKTCGETFPSEAKHTEHLKEHPLECHICGKNFYRIPNLRLHIKRHMGVRPYKCDVCSKAFLTKQKLREHHNIHTGNAPIKCNLCDETFRRYSNLVQHRNRHHLNIKKKVKDFVCPCGEVFHSKSKFNWHKEIHEAKPKSCKYCYEKFVHMASLTRHIRRAHNQRYVPEVKRENENVECRICKGVYLKSSLDAHLYTHTGKKQHSCPICNKDFTTKWNLKLHKWTHASPTSKPFKCDQCQSAFIRKSDYTSHMNSHRSIRPYTCNYCGCKFIRKYNCVRHVREHEEGKSYNCEICNKSFHRSYYLKEHMRVHSGVRPFSCHICGKTSTTKSNHNKHMKIHHAREPVSTEG